MCEFFLQEWVLVTRSHNDIYSDLIYGHSLLCVSAHESALKRLSSAESAVHASVYASFDWISSTITISTLISHGFVDRAA